MWQVNNKELTLTCFLEFVLGFFCFPKAVFFLILSALRAHYLFNNGEREKGEIWTSFFHDFSAVLSTSSVLNLRGVSSLFHTFFNHLTPKTRRWETTSTACLSIQHISSLKHLSQQDSLAFRRWMDTLVQANVFCTTLSCCFNLETEGSLVLDGHS